MNMYDWALCSLELNQKLSYRTVPSIIREEDRVEMKAHSTRSEIRADLILSSM